MHTGAHAKCSLYTVIAGEKKSDLIRIGAIRSGNTRRRFLGARGELPEAESIRQLPPHHQR